MSQTFSSTSDRRTENNTVRFAYRVLTDDEKAQMDRLKTLTQDLIDLCNSIGKSRELSLAVTNYEQACMWACKHVTRPPEA